MSSNLKLQGGFDFSEGTSSKGIFDVEIEKLRADFSFNMSRRSESCLVLRENS
jgi:hypothetical protein